MAQVQSIFRGQLEFDEQRSLFDYWQSKCTGSFLPTRSDISPTEFVRHLPMISLLDVCGKEQTGNYRVRLAGTGLYPYFQKEITGKTLDEVYDAPRQQYWQERLNNLVDTQKPACGTISPDASVVGHAAQFWMRLPLVGADGKVNMILAYDVFKSLSAVYSKNQSKVVYA